MSTAPHPLAVIRDYRQLREALRAWCDQIGMTRAQLDQRAGLATGHSGKLLAPRGGKGFGNTSLRWILAAAGLALVLVEDNEAIAELEQHAGDPLACRKHPPAPHWRTAKGPAWYRHLAARRTLKLTPERRSEIAKTAARARWQRKQPSQ